MFEQMRNRVEMLLEIGAISDPITTQRGCFSYLSWLLRYAEACGADAWTLDQLRKHVQDFEKSAFLATVCFVHSTPRTECGESGCSLAIKTLDGQTVVASWNQINENILFVSQFVTFINSLNCMLQRY